MKGPKSWCRPIGKVGLGGIAVLFLTMIACVQAQAALGESDSHSPSPAARISQSASPIASSQSPTQSGQLPPMLAYFYIWFNPSSWNHYKIDYPLLGRYSSNDMTIMRQQVKIAKQAGITGFLVSWKDTPTLDRRLAALRSVAAAAGFKLGIVLEGRDYYGNPMPMNKVRQSFGYLTQHYASDPVFNIFGKPLIAWSGTWLFSTKDMASVTKTYGSKLMILATEKEPGDYQLIAGLFAGDAYYWSSADPRHTPGYRSKLVEFSRVVHQHQGLWIAPAASGFDARRLGGVRNIGRDRGQTLRLEINAAMASSPDAIGLISWNEYSENSQIEPSQRYGNASLKVVAAFEHAKAPVVTNFDSSSPAGFDPGPSQLVILGFFIVLLGGSVAIVVRRR